MTRWQNTSTGIAQGSTPSQVRWPQNHLTIGSLLMAQAQILSSMLKHYFQKSSIWCTEQ